MTELSHQNSLIDQIVLDNQDVRLRPDVFNLARVLPFLLRLIIELGLRVRALLGLSESCLDEEAERRAFAILGSDLDTAAHKLGDFCYHQSRLESGIWAQLTPADKETEAGSAEDSVSFSYNGRQRESDAYIRAHVRPVRSAGTAYRAPWASIQDLYR